MLGYFCHFTFLKGDVKILFLFPLVNPVIQYRLILPAAVHHQTGHMQCEFTGFAVALRCEIEAEGIGANGP